MKNIKTCALTLLLLSFSTTAAMQELKIPDELNAVSTSSQTFDLPWGNQVYTWPSNPVCWRANGFRVTPNTSYYELDGNIINFYIGTAINGNNYIDVPEYNIRAHLGKVIYAMGDAGANAYLHQPGESNAYQTTNNNDCFYGSAAVKVYVGNFHMVPIDPSKAMKRPRYVYIYPVPKTALVSTRNSDKKTYSFSWSDLKYGQYTGNWNISQGGVLNVENTVDVAVGSQNIANIGTLKCTPTSSLVVTTTMEPERLLIDGTPWQSGSRILCSGTEIKKITVKGPTQILSPGKHTWTINFDYYVS